MTYILVVEDEPSLARVLRDILEFEGYTVRVAENGLSALQQSEQERPSLILLDLMLPVLDGWGFLRARQQDPALAQVPVIVLSALHKAEATLQGLQVTQYLGQPYDLEELLRLVVRCLELRQGAVPAPSLVCAGSRC